MANVAHSSLTGASLHEPKGAAAATAGQIYVANGSGSGSWTSVEGLVITGMVADFMTPIAPIGWLELDGTNISTTTYSALYNVVTIQRTGTRTGGLKPITGLSTTAGIRAGYYVFGTGIVAGTQVTSVDSGTQITMNTNASNSGTNTVIFSPWYLNTGTMTLPDMTTAGKFRRSRSAAFEAGTVQTDQNKTHTHTGTTTSGGVDHNHQGNSTDAGGVDHTHPQSSPSSTVGQFVGPITANNGWSGNPANSAATGLTSSYLHQHTFTTNTASQWAHSHTFTTDANGSSEVRPTSIVFMTCVKT
jgi:hypothetical protein